MYLFHVRSVVKGHFEVTGRPDPISYVDNLLNDEAYECKEWTSVSLISFPTSISDIIKAPAHRFLGEIIPKCIADYFFTGNRTSLGRHPDTSVSFNPLSAWLIALTSTFIRHSIQEYKIMLQCGNNKRQYAEADKLEGTALGTPQCAVANM